MMRSAFVLTLTASFLSVPVAAQVAPADPEATATSTGSPVDQVKLHEAVGTLATQLEENFVFPDKGRAYAEMLRANLQAGRYSDFRSAEAFADALTRDLQAVHKDGHLRVHVVPAHSRGGPQAERRGPPSTLNAISKSGWLADGIAYVRFEGFPGTDATMAALEQFLAEHRQAKTLIIDARTHRGGGLSEMDMLFPALFPKPTLLVGMDTRLAAEQRQGDGETEASLKHVSGPEGVVRREHWVTPASPPTGLSSAKVYLLVSNRTASAGEHLALSLKRTARATLIGEATRGAGHYGSMVPLDEDMTFAAFIPVGRTFDPDTGEGWEGTGVEPHVHVPPNQALDEALRLAGVNKSAQDALAQLKTPDGAAE